MNPIGCCVCLSVSVQSFFPSAFFLISHDRPSVIRSKKEYTPYQPLLKLSLSCFNYEDGNKSDPMFIWAFTLFLCFPSEKRDYYFIFFGSFSPPLFLLLLLPLPHTHRKREPAAMLLYILREQLLLPPTILIISITYHDHHHMIITAIPLSSFFFSAFFC